MIGIYGGTFNPVHYGHLRTALEVKELFALDQLRLIPCRLPVHREAPEVSAELRLHMLEIALSNTVGLHVDRRELDRPGPSYMVDTLQSLRAENPEQTLVLFMGLDAFAGLERWHRWQTLFELAHLVVMTRPAFARPALSAFLQQRLCHERQQLQQQRAGLLCFASVTALDISASLIRQLIAHGRDPKFLLPDELIGFIRQHQLYFLTQDLECKQNNY